MNTTTQILIFKTNISSCKDSMAIKEVLDNQSQILQWSVDTKDIDCVLRIEADNISNEDIIRLINSLGYQCSVLE